ncbi:MAG: SIS domain-containing protein [Chloroflexi bacterium]|jgi:D-sedoheptulose 7-phosphate isomerase|nr:SIS domain-containing protein [Chloroflexota bacterium]
MSRIDAYLASLSARLTQIPAAGVAAVEAAVWDAYQRDAMIFTCGNGGSAASATHLACDLQKWTIAPGRRRMRAMSLGDNPALLSAWGNDAAYADVFVEPLQNLFRPGDLVLAISGSGNSPNVLRAIAWANDHGGTTVGLSGFDGGALARLAQVALVVPSAFMPEVEDLHLALCHGLAVTLAERIRASAA